MALAIDRNHLAANGLGLCAYFAPWKAAGVAARVFSSHGPGAGRHSTLLVSSFDF
jgi:hypothetical protein